MARKNITTSLPEDHAAIGRYAAKNGNAVGIKKFKATHSVGESTTRLFKNKYVEDINKQYQQSPDIEVKVRSLLVLMSVWMEGDAGKATQWQSAELCMCIEQWLECQLAKVS